MRRALIVALAALFTGFYLAPMSASATEGSDGPSFSSCKNLAGWYANPDEQDSLPEPTVAGLKFAGKDLIHHATNPIDLADMDKVTGTFVATEPGKVVFKVETSAPYSTIITNIDGKFWSTAMTYDQEGGQGHPVNKVSDLVGLDTKPGKAKYTSASAVVTFGVGYWVEEGTTVVSSISFHGHTYDLTCAPPVVHTSSPSASASTSTKPSASASASRSVSISPSASRSGVAGGVAGGDEPSLPVTGAPAALIVVVGLALIAGGIGLFAATRRRKVTFEA